MPSAGERRAAVRSAIVAGGVTGPADLAARLEQHGIEVAPEELRGHLRALGVVRVAGPDGPVLAVPAERGTAPPPALAPDRVLQLTVVAVAAAFLLVGLLGWLLA